MAYRDIDYTKKFKLDPTHYWGKREFDKSGDDLRYNFYANVHVWCDYDSMEGEKFYYTVDNRSVSREEFKNQLAIRKTPLYKAIYG